MCETRGWHMDRDLQVGLIHRRTPTAPRLGFEFLNLTMGNSQPRTTDEMSMNKHQDKMHFETLAVAFGLVAGVIASPAHMNSQVESHYQQLSGMTNEQAKATLCLFCPPSCTSRFKRDLDENAKRELDEVTKRDLARELFKRGTVVGSAEQTCIPSFCGCGQRPPTPPPPPPPPPPRPCDSRFECCFEGDPACCDPDFECCFPGGRFCRSRCDPMRQCCYDRAPGCGGGGGGGGGGGDDSYQD
ncbi:hypothetical protein CP532_6726 [Ophiocordyceps camponoti-leonardi (nom. inval.)]|nr:hypothetical protein CP532_6726 [Ophiocordyceps camponoti-leonardi (nom. inval.)]